MISFSHAYKYASISSADKLVPEIEHLSLTCHPNSISSSSGCPPPDVHPHHPPPHHQLGLQTSPSLWYDHTHSQSHATHS